MLDVLDNLEIMSIRQLVKSKTGANRHSVKSISRLDTYSKNLSVLSRKNELFEARFTFTLRNTSVNSVFGVRNIYDLR